MVEYENVFHPTLTAETHNFPTGIAPFPGAETGTGGRLRDVQGTWVEETWGVPYNTGGRK
jgi:phosphoribosylformylglycinamidine synthase